MMRTHLSSARLALLLGVAVLAKSVVAADNSPDLLAPVASKFKADEATLDLSVPESPAFAVLGVTPQTVLRPTSPRELATSLLNGVDANGNLQSGLALDTAPYLLLAGDRLTLKDYRQNKDGWNVLRLFARTQASVATTKGSSSDDKSLRIALGFRVTPWDEGDPRLDDELLRHCLDPLLVKAQNGIANIKAQHFAKILSEHVADLPALTSNPALDMLDNWKQLPTAQQHTLDPETQAMMQELTDLEGSIGKAGADCLADARKRNWNRSAWDLGAAPSWISTDGTTDNVKWDGGAVWTSLAYGFEHIPTLEETAQFIVHARYRTDEQVTAQTPSGTFFRQDSAFVGGRFRLGTDSFNLSVEGMFIHTDPKGHRGDNSERLSVGGELKLTKDLWLDVTIGGDGGRSDGRNQAFVLSALKWGFSSEPALQWKPL